MAFFVAAFTLCQNSTILITIIGNAAGVFPAVTVLKKGSCFIKKTRIILFCYAAAYLVLSVLVATGRLSLSAKYFLPLNLASLVFTLADFLDYGIKCLVWLASKGRLEYQIRHTNHILQKLEACAGAKAKKRTALLQKCCKCEASANHSLEKLNARTQQLGVNSPLTSWIYVSSPISLAVLLVFSDKLPLILSDSLIAATTILPLGFLFLNMFFEHLMHETDERFLNEAVVSLYSIEHQKKGLEEQLCFSAAGGNPQAQ